MKKLTVLLFTLVVFVFSGCTGGNNLELMGAQKTGKFADLEYTDIGVTSKFKFAGIATGTYKALAAEAGLVYYAGTKNVYITLDAKQNWEIKATSKSQNFAVPGLGVKIQNPYVATVKRNGKVIGNIGLELPKVDKTQTALKMVGLDKVFDKNLDLKGSALILNEKFKITSVYTGTDKVKKNSPYGYRVSKGKKTLGLIQVGKNLMGGQELKVWIAPKLDPLTEQKVMAALLVCGYAI